MLKRVVFVMIGIGLIEAVYGLIQALVPSMGVLWVDYVQAYLGTARGTFINRNNFAGFIEMIWPLALGITLAMTGRVYSLKEALGSDKLNRQALMALGIIVFLLALIFTRSRAGIVSGLIGFLVFSIMARTGMKDVALQTRVLLGGIIVLLCIYTMTIGVGPIMERFLTIGGDGNSRMDIWRDSLPIIKDHPLGIGLGNYENVFQVYNQSFITDKTVIHAHNDYLQLLIETGWIGFFAIVGGFLIFLGKSARRIKRLDFRRDPLRFYLAVGAFSGLISMTVHSMFDFNRRMMNVEHRTSNINFE
ncbi:MAG: O-antigen ligase family protein [Desulfosarcina sp.]|nr:O-antigen ligase family protein [Desulfosarcina sp.]